MSTGILHTAVTRLSDGRVMRQMGIRHEAGPLFCYTLNQRGLLGGGNVLDSGRSSG